MHPLALAAFLGSLSGALLSTAATLGPPAWVLGWPALSSALLALAYATGRAGFLGKRADGTHPAWAWALFAPYFVFTLLMWRGQKLLGEDAFNAVAPGLWVGRRVFGHELPDELHVVVDLTAEFTEPHGVRTRARYLCLPTLDAHAPDAARLRALVAALKDETRPIFIHCASGHGRSASVAAALMMVRGQARSAAEAQEHMRKARPQVHIKAVQMARINALFSGAGQR